MQAKDTMTKDPACCTPDMNLPEVAKLMVDHDCGEIPVVESKDHPKPVGTVTDRDITSRVETQRSRSRWWTLRSIFVVAAVFNYAWEPAQSPLYVGMGSLDQVWWHCFLASLGDGLLVLLIFAAGWMVLHRQDWFVSPACAGMQ